MKSTMRMKSTKRMKHDTHLEFSIHNYALTQLETSITCSQFANALSTILFNGYSAGFPRAGGLHNPIYLGVLFHIPTPRKSFKNLFGRGAFL